MLMKRIDTGSQEEDERAPRSSWRNGNVGREEEFSVTARCPPVVGVTNEQHLVNEEIVDMDEAVDLDDDSTKGSMVVSSR